MVSLTIQRLAAASQNAVTKTTERNNWFGLGSCASIKFRSSILPFDKATTEFNPRMPCLDGCSEARRCGRDSRRDQEFAAAKHGNQMRIAEFTWTKQAPRWAALLQRQRQDSASP